MTNPMNQSTQQQLGLSLPNFDPEVRTGLLEDTDAEPQAEQGEKRFFALWKTLQHTPETIDYRRIDLETLWSQLLSTLPDEPIGLRDVWKEIATTPENDIPGVFPKFSPHWYQWEWFFTMHAIGLLGFTSHKDYVKRMDLKGEDKKLLKDFWNSTVREMGRLPVLDPWVQENSKFIFIQAWSYLYQSPSISKTEEGFKYGMRIEHHRRKTWENYLTSSEPWTKNYLVIRAETDGIPGIRNDKTDEWCRWQEYFITAGIRLKIDIETAKTYLVKNGIPNPTVLTNLEAQWKETEIMLGEGRTEESVEPQDQVHKDGM